jgi:integrase/recombinase XerD
MQDMPAIQIPSITIITRHSRECSHAGDPEYKRCDCFKSLRFFEDGRMNYQATKQRTWAGAERFRHDFIASYGQPLADNASLSDAVTAFIAFKKGQDIASTEINKYERELERLVEFMEARKRPTPRSVTLADLSEYRLTWSALYPSSATRSGVQTRLKAFFKYCLASDLVTKNSALLLSPISNDRPRTQPFTAEEYNAIIEAIPDAFTTAIKRQRIRALVQCMRWSGVAIIDATTMKRSRLVSEKFNGGLLWSIVCRRQKTDNDVRVPIPEIVAEELLAVPNDCPDYFFWNTGKGKPVSAANDKQTDMRILFRTAGVADGHSHRFRDTFACDLLSRGVSIELVSKMLGHSSIRTTERYYSAWVQSRQVHLNTVMSGIIAMQQPLLNRLTDGATAQ